MNYLELIKIGEQKKMAKTLKQINKDISYWNEKIEESKANESEENELYNLIQRNVYYKLLSECKAEKSDKKEAIKARKKKREIKVLEWIAKYDPYIIPYGMDYPNISETIKEILENRGIEDPEELAWNSSYESGLDEQMNLFLPEVNFKNDLMAMYYDAGDKPKYSINSIPEHPGKNVSKSIILDFVHEEFFKYLEETFSIKLMKKEQNQIIKQVKRSFN